MKPLLLLFLPLLASCNQSAYSRAVQNQMIDADDRQDGNIFELQQQVGALQQRQSDEAAARAKGDADVMVVVRAQGNEIEAYHNQEEARANSR